MALPPIRAPEYGDMAKLGSLRLTQNPASDVQRMVNPAGGRPQKQAGPEAIAAKAAQQQAQQEAVDPNHIRLMRGAVYAQSKLGEWVRIANNPNAGPRTRSLARAAILRWRELFEHGRANTPFFEDVNG